MQAITTKYLGATNTLPSRIKASCPQGFIVLSWDHEFSTEENHAFAAMALVRKLGWVPKNPISGDHQNRYVGAWAMGSIRGGFAFTLAFGAKADPMNDSFCWDFSPANAKASYARN